MDVVIRRAEATDVRTVQALIEVSVRGLHSADYTQVQIERALEAVYGVDTQLITDATYFVAQRTDDRTIVGCGGWSKRQTLFGGDKWSERQPALLDPVHDAAKIRAFFVHPQAIRRGIGSRLLATCEAAAAAAGFTRFEMGATLGGALLYAARGYRVRANVDIALAGGIALPIVLMEKIVVAERPLT